MPTFKELEIFFKLCENPHISNLAKELPLTQSAISISINSLEKKLDEKLFDRIGKKLVLNERGRVFKEMTYSHFEAIKNAKEEFSNDKLKGELKISSSKTFNSMKLSQMIYNFIKDEQIEIKKSTNNTSTIIKDILEGVVDIGFVENEFESSKIIKEKIKDDYLILVSSDENLKNKTFYIDQLFHKKWILREEGSGTREVFLNKINHMEDFKITMETSSFYDIKNILINNPETITCISKLAVKEEIKKKRLFEVKIHNIDFNRNLYMIYHKDKFKSKLFLEFTEFIKRSFLDS